MREWMHGLKMARLLPIIEVIEECQMSEWQEREIYWISRLGYEGHCLLNQTVGGNGVGCHLPETIEKMTRIQNEPERRKFHEDLARSLHKNPSFKSKQMAGFRKWIDLPETRKANGDRLRKFRKDPEFCAKQVAASTAITSKPVLKIDPKTGEVLAKFRSVSETSKRCDISKCSLFKAIEGGKPSKGFLWKYPEGYSYKYMPRNKPISPSQN